jgi:hypothetical protein
VAHLGDDGDRGGRDDAMGAEVGNDYGVEMGMSIRDPRSGSFFSINMRVSNGFIGRV